MIRNKKASTAVVVIVVIIAIVLIIAVIALLIILNQKGYISPPSQNITNSQFKLILEAKDFKSGESVAANYAIYDFNDTKLAEATIDKDEKREIDLPSEPVIVYCWSNDYYLRKAIKLLSDLDIQYGRASFSCDMEKIEQNLKVTYSGTLSNKLSTIVLNLTAKDKFQKASLCYGYTSGFKGVGIKEQFITCDAGFWRNYTDYNQTKQDYNYLPEGEYICGDRIESCEVAQQNKCKMKNEEIPSRFKSKVDGCFNLGMDVDSDSASVTLLVEQGDFVTRTDYIDLYIYDYDRRYSPEENKYIYYSEYQSEDIGAKDIYLKIPYEG